MPRVSTRFSVLAATLIAINVIGLVWIHHSLTSAAGARIRVLSALPTNDVDAADRFVLVLDEPLADSDVVDEPLERSPFTIEPQPPGRWVWAARDRLEYRLDAPLNPGRVYSIRPAADFEAQTGRSLVGESEFRFETRPLELLAYELDTIDRTHGTVAFLFNQPVGPNDLLDHLRLSESSLTPVTTGSPSLDEASDLTPVCLTREPSERLVVRIDRPAENKLYFTLDGSLCGFGGELSLGLPVTERVTFEPRFSLDCVYNVSAPSLDEDATVRLDFTHRLKADQTLPSVEIVPPVKNVQVSIWSDELHLTGPFECGQRYTATVGPTLLAANGSTLGESQSTSFEIPDRSPGLQLSCSKGILSPRGNLSLDLKVVNVAGVKLSATRVLPNNLVSHLHGARAGATSRPIVERTTALDLQRNQPKSMAVNLADLLGRPLGIYLIEAEATDQTWTDDEAIVTVTDLAITSKQERGGLLVWITSLSTAAPAAGVEVSALSYNNQILAAGVTDESGVVHLDIPPNHPDGAPWVIVAQRGEDVAYLQPNERPWMLDDVDQSGRDTPETYDVMLYPERGVYRPGDTIHLTGIIRDASGTIPPAFPLSVAVERPDGRKVSTLAVTPNENGQGVFHVDYTPPIDGQTGRYQFTATLPGSKTPLGETSALVEAFVPVRLELDAQPTAPRFGPGEQPSLNVSARYLFNKAAANLPVTASGRYIATPFESRQFPGFAFGNSAADNRAPLPDARTQLDDAGRATIQLDPPKDEPPGRWTLRAAVTVTEPSSRSVSQNVTTLVDTVDRFVGLDLPAGRLVPAKTEIELEWIVTTGADELAEPAPIEVHLQTVEFDWVLQKVDDRTVWKTVEKLDSVLKTTVGDTPDATPRGVLKLVCPKEGRYRITATDKRSGSQTVIEFHATGTDSEAGLLALNRPERLEITLDHDRYIPGTDAAILVRSPFVGTLLLTIETDRVIHHQVVEMESNSVTLDWTIPDDLRGGAFVTGTVIRPIDSSKNKWLPHRAMGMARLSTNHCGQRLDILLDAPEKARPGETITIVADAGPPADPDRPAVIHLWAVDEGILLTTSHDTPDPLDYFFAPRAGVIETADVFFDLLPDHKRPDTMQHIGAGLDEEESFAARRNPVATRQRQPAVVWQTVQQTDANGQITSTMTMPEMTGRMRLMVVAVDQDRYGSTEHGVTVTAPLVMEAGWPRFAAPGDLFSVPIKLFNNSEQPLTVSLSLEVDGPLTIEPIPNGGHATLPPGQSSTILLKASATEIGPVTVKCKATATAESGEELTARCEADLPIRPAAPLHTESQMRRVEAGESLTLDAAAGFIPGTVRTTIHVSASPKIELLPAAESLIHYPYGCVEQTTSQLVALLYAGDVLSREAEADVRGERTKELIAAGINRLWAMQTRSGGLGYWPGDRQPHLWGSAYAAGFLAEAKRAGYALDAGFIRDLLAYLKQSLSSDNNDVTSNVRAMICRVLAEFGQPQEGWMARLSERPDQLDVGGRAHLAAAWLAAGQKPRATELLRDDTLEQRIATVTGGRITSQVRQEALLLQTLCELAPDHAWCPTLARRLQAANVNGVWGSTLENATALAALSSYQTHAQANPQFTGTIEVGDEQVLSFDHSQPATYTVADPTGPIQIATSGSGPIFVSITTEGLSQDAATREYDRQLAVRRTWTTSKGQPLNLTKLRVGDLIHVEITLCAPDLERYESVDNVVIVDALPAGVEVENPRLASSADVDWATDYEPDRTEFLDDRVLLFTSATKETQSFVYAVRVTQVGSFKLPPIQASCMYDPGFASIHGGTEITVE